jgi:hypothetical protein
MAGKTTLQEIRKKYPFEHTDLANLAGVNPPVVDWMLEGKPVVEWQAIEVLRVLAMITKENYRLDTVEVILHPETVREE